jgi:hypothetical protein
VEIQEKQVVQVKFATFAGVLLVLATAPGVLAGEESWGTRLDSQIRDEWSGANHRAFDFWIGEWEMTWRGKPPGQFHFDTSGNTMRHRVFPVLGGKAVIELAWDINSTSSAPSGRGFSIRYFDETRLRWVMTQNWPSAGNDGFGFIDQLIGFEDNGRLSMYSTARRPNDDGTFQLYHRQYNFADIRDGAFRWDGSNSYDEAVSWQTWNIVDAKRVRALDPFTAAGTAWPGQVGDLLCPDEPHGGFDSLEGNWTGTVRYANGSEAPVSLSAGRLLDGCAVASILLHDDGRRVFSATGYIPRLQKWITYQLDNQPGTGHRYSWSNTAGAGAEFNAVPSLAIIDEFTPFLAPDTFTRDIPRQRTIWSVFEQDRLSFEEQSRDSVNGPWKTDATYRLQRAAN